MAADVSRIQFKENILQTIGSTPIVRMNRISHGLPPHIFAKVEFFNPGGSVKDRIGFGIVEAAEKNGQLKPGGTIVEATSGNTGLGLAITAAVKGYKCVFTMPDKMSKEKIQILRSFGARVIITPTAVPHGSPESYTEVAKRIVAETPNSILADQYNNPKNPEAHYLSTGPEIWEQTGGQLDVFVCTIGTGGTITGTGKYLKEQNPDIKIVGVDPKGSVIHEFYYTKAYPHTIKTYLVEGIGQDYIPNTLDVRYVDDVVQVDDKESFAMARKLTREEGIFVGGSAGSAMAGALKYAASMKPDQVMLVLLPDTGERYLSKLYDDDWMRENSMLATEKITVRYILDHKKGLPDLVAVSPENTVRDALNILKHNNFYQLPVFEKGQSVGSVLENDLMSIVLEDPSRFERRIGSVMRPPFPSVHPNEVIGQVMSHLSQRNLAVLVVEDEKVIGILTKYDVIEYLSH